MFNLRLRVSLEEAAAVLAELSNYDEYEGRTIEVSTVRDDDAGSADGIRPFGY